MEVRPTHGNLYYNWRLPHVYKTQGQGAVKEREVLLMKVLDSVRVDAFRTLTERVTLQKKNDSNTEPTFTAELDTAEEQDATNVLVGLFSSFQVGDDVEKSSQSREVERVWDFRSADDTDDDYDHEEGGTSLT
jgi:hypothetical protein